MNFFRDLISDDFIDQLKTTGIKIAKSVAKDVIVNCANKYLSDDEDDYEEERYYRSTTKPSVYVPVATGYDYSMESRNTYNNDDMYAHTNRRLANGLIPAISFVARR